MEKHPTCAEMMTWTSEQIHTHLETCSAICIPGENALREVLRDEKGREASVRRALKTAIRTDGMVKKGRVPLRGNRCPTKRDLR